MAKPPIVLVHGYSDTSRGYDKWCELLQARGYQGTTIHLVDYISLSNEITIKDIAEGFDRALRVRAGLKADEPFDAIVHSTGMLVVREWLTTYARRSSRLKHLIGLAPATFGSPMAHKGRSWLGGIFKGGKDLGPDFLEAGDLVLSGLELGSRYTWRLAELDLLPDGPAVYGPTSRTPYPFIFVGLKDYGWLKRAVTEPGTDGTVRWAGVGFDSRKVTVDLTIDPAAGDTKRIQLRDWKNAEVPLVFVEGVNHGTILSDPTPALVDSVLEALAVSSGPEYAAWTAKYTKKPKPDKRWQQFVVHAVDERGDGIPDYYIRLGQVVDGKFRELPFDMDVHAYKEDPSYRCFHVNLDDVEPEKIENLALRVIASTGTELVSYRGFSSSATTALPKHETNKWDALIEFDAALPDFTFFYPFTTTLVELRMNREPEPGKLTIIKGLNDPPSPGQA